MNDGIPTELPTAAQLVGRLRIRAAAVGLSLPKLCARAGIAPTTPARWESGATSLRWDLYHRLHSALLRVEAEFNGAHGCPSGGTTEKLAPQASGACAGAAAAAFSGEGAGGVLVAPGSPVGRP